MNEPSKPDQGTVHVKCSKCGHEFDFSYGWAKVSIIIGCPKCAEVIRLRPFDTSNPLADRS